MRQKLSDNKDRRLGVERRQFKYHMHIPEYRSGKERRNGDDRKRKLRTTKS